MNKIIEIEELGFPKSLIIREKSLVSELIDTKDLVNELNEQLRQYNVVGRSEQFKCEKCGSDWGEVRATCFSCNHESEDLST